MLAEKLRAEGFYPALFVSTVDLPEVPDSPYVRGALFPNGQLVLLEDLKRLVVPLCERDRVRDRPSPTGSLQRFLTVLYTVRPDEDPPRLSDRLGNDDREVPADYEDDPANENAISILAKIEEDLEVNPCVRGRLYVLGACLWSAVNPFSNYGRLISRFPWVEAPNVLVFEGFFASPAYRSEVFRILPLSVLAETYAPLVERIRQEILRPIRIRLDLLREVLNELPTDLTPEISTKPDFRVVSFSKTFSEDPDRRLVVHFHENSILQLAKPDSASAVSAIRQALFTLFGFPATVVFSQKLLATLSPEEKSFLTEATNKLRSKMDLSLSSGLYPALDPETSNRFPLSLAACVFRKRFDSTVVSVVRPACLCFVEARETATHTLPLHTYETLPPSVTGLMTFSGRNLSALSNAVGRRIRNVLADLDAETDQNAEISVPSVS